MRISWAPTLTSVNIDEAIAVASKALIATVSLFLPGRAIIVASNGTPSDIIKAVFMKISLDMAITY